MVHEGVHEGVGRGLARHLDLMIEWVEDILEKPLEVLQMSFPMRKKMLIFYKWDLLVVVRVVWMNLMIFEIDDPVESKF